MVLQGTGYLRGPNLGFSRKEVEFGQSTRVNNGTRVKRSRVRFSAPERFFTEESLLKTTHDYIRLSHTVNSMCATLFTIMTPAVHVRDVPELNKQLESGVRPKKVNLVVWATSGYSFCTKYHFQLHTKSHNSLQRIKYSLYATNTYKLQTFSN